MKRALIFICVLLTAGSLYAEKTTQKDIYPLIPFNTELSDVLQLSKGFTAYNTYRFEVTPDVYALTIKIRNATADLDIYVKYGEEIVSYDDVDAEAITDAFNEELYLSRFSDTPLKDGLYYFDICYQLRDLPVVNGEELNEVTFDFIIEPLILDIAAELREGLVHTDTLSPENEMMKIFSIEVPERAEVLRLDIFNTEADIDLFVARDVNKLNRDEALYFQDGYLGQETLLIDANSIHPLEKGTYYIAVFDQVSAERLQTFSILANFHAQPPEALLDIPGFPPYEDELGKALLATVELITKHARGSGSLVSRNGHILTNWHVISNSDNELSDTIYVAVGFSHYSAPVELFQAEVVKFDQEKDLALLKITKGLYGQELPQDYQFPFFRLGDEKDLRIAQPISLIGYPASGGLGSRSSVSLTRGLIAGFERLEHGLLFKTDALFSAGSSGGAAINIYYELIGIPTMFITQSNAQFGFIQSIGMLPQEWRQIIAQSK